MVEVCDVVVCGVVFDVLYLFEEELVCLVIFEDVCIGFCLDDEVFF